MSNNANKPRYSIDLSRSKYNSRYDRLLNILFFSQELPSDLHLHTNLSYCNFRKTIYILRQRNLIKTNRKDGKVSYVLTLEGKQLTRQLNYIKYRSCLEDIKRQYDIKHRIRKFRFAYLYALLDRAGIPYETFAKPSISETVVFADNVYFYTAADLKRTLGLEATSFKGSRMMGLLVGKGKIIVVYKTGKMMASFSSVEKLIPIFLMRYFSTPVETAILICDNNQAVIDISGQIINNIANDPKLGVNTDPYKYFYVFTDGDSFLSHFEDLYADRSAKVRNLIHLYNIDTSEKDKSGRNRLKIGTGFIGDSPVWICPGNVNAVTLKLFIYNAELYSHPSFIVCQQRDQAVLDEITKDTSIEVIAR